MLYDEDGVPAGWENVTLGEDFDAFCDAAERGDMEAVEEIVERAYQRMYAREGRKILASEGIE